MAQVFPSMDVIARLPEYAGERHLLDLLLRLDDTFEIYFQSYLNNNRPDIVLMRKGYGVMIIEVKDWELSKYYISNDQEWRIRSSDKVIKSPILQVIQYKKQLVELQIIKLLEYSLKDPRFLGIVKCAVYFHKSKSSEINKYLSSLRSNKLDIQLKYELDCFGMDQLNLTAFKSILRKRYLINKTPSFLFQDNIYNNFKRYLLPPKHTREEGESIQLTKQQKLLAISEPNVSIRVKGAVGSGKTTVMTRRAVNAHKRHGGIVLILFFNITLKNFLKYKLSLVEEEFDWDYFHFETYHDFIKKKMNDLQMDFTITQKIARNDTESRQKYFDLHYFSNTSLFDGHEDEIYKYKTVLIDELQDYQRPWLDIIKKYFLEEGGEYVLWGDEKQNIYNLPLVSKDIITNVPGRPRLLKSNFRSSAALNDLTLNFQKLFFREKYNLDNDSEFKQEELDFGGQSLIKYHFNSDSNEINIPYLCQKILEYSEKTGSHPGNIVVMGFRIDVLRAFEAYYRALTGEKTITVFETLEFWLRLILAKNLKKDFISSFTNFFPDHINKYTLLNDLSKAISFYALHELDPSPGFDLRTEKILDQHGISLASFIDWWRSREVRQFFNLGSYYSSNAMEQKFPVFRYIHQDIKKIRRYKKEHFRADPAMLKVTTIHSFKGWEADTVFIILENQFDTDAGFKNTFNEILYTAITRAKKNLIIINFGNRTLHQRLQSLFNHIG